MLCFKQVHKVGPNEPVTVFDIDYSKGTITDNASVPIVINTRVSNGMHFQPAHIQSSVIYFLTLQNVSSNFFVLNVSFIYCGMFGYLDFLQETLAFFNHSLLLLMAIFLSCLVSHKKARIRADVVRSSRIWLATKQHYYDKV